MILRPCSLGGNFQGADKDVELVPKVDIWGLPVYRK